MTILSNEHLWGHDGLGLAPGSRLLATIEAGSRWRGAARLNWAALILASITLVGLLLRLSAISSMPLWSDEALTLLISKWPVGTLMLRAVDPTPGLYYLLHKLLIPDSAGVTGVRAISLVCGVALIPLSALFGAIVGGRRVGLLTAGFVALSAPLIDYSQEARAYALLTLLVIGSAIGLLLTLRAMIRDNIFHVRPAVIFAISALLAFYTHFVALFWIGPAVVLLALTAARSGDASVQRATRLTILAMIFFALPGAARLFASMTNDIGFDWLPQASLGQFFATLAEQILPLGMWSPKPSDPGRASSFVALVLTVFLAGVAYWRAGVRMRQLPADFPASAQVLAIFLLLPFVLWAFGALSKPIFMPRTMLWSVPGILTVIALLLDRLDRRWLMAMTGLAYAASLAASGTMRIDRQDTRPFQNEIARDQQPGDVLMVCRTWRAPELRHAAIALLPLPLLVPLGEDMAMVERSFGSDPRWQDHFGWLVTRPAPKPIPRSILTSGRTWLLASKCNERDRRRINRWLGPGRWIRVRDDPPTALLPVILWRFDPAQSAKSRPVLDFSGV